MKYSFFALILFVFTAGLNAQNASSIRPVTGIQSKENLKNGEYRDKGIIVKRRKGDMTLIVKYEKLSPKILEHKKEVESAALEMSQKMLYNIESDNPYNPNWIAKPNLNYVRRDVSKMQNNALDILFKIPKKDIRYDNVRAKIIALLLFTQSREMERGKFINANSPVSNTDQNDYRRFMQMAIYIRALEIMIEQDMAAIK